MAGSNNDLDILNASPLVRDIFNKTFNFHLESLYVIVPGLSPASHQTYLVVDGIYPRWPIFVLPTANPRPEQVHLKEAHSARRMGVERALEF